MVQKIGLIAIVLGMSWFASAQRNVKDSVLSTPWVSVHYGAMWTSGDLADRYGFMNHVGATAGYKTSKNWFWGMDGNFSFGSKIRIQGLFDDLIDSYGNITDVNGDIAKVALYTRGFNVNLAVGKIFPVFHSNPNSGIWVHAGGGYLLHKLRVESQDQVIPQIELKYKKGYDRLTVGMNLHQFAGYSFMAGSGLMSFYAGFYIQEGFTRNQRDVFFDQPEIPVDKSLRLDIQYGLRAGWFIPIYKRQPKDFYFD
jgi:hypothetical protein